MSLPSSRPPPAPKSNNAKYVVVLLVLIAGIGVTLWLRKPAVQPPVPAPVASAPPAAPTNPRLEDIPPPPPPEDSAEAKPTGPRVVYVQNAGCDGKCRGTSPPELGQALQVRASQARRCYNQALAQDSQLKGHVSISVRIGPSGNVCSASVASNDMGTPSVANCAANIFRMANAYPSPRGGCVDANIPISFVQQQH